MLALIHFPGEDAPTIKEIGNVVTVYLWSAPVHERPTVVEFVPEIRIAARGFSEMIVAMKPTDHEHWRNVDAILRAQR